MPDLIWDDLRVFVAVASAGSVAGAARTLSVEHSTVVRRLTRLEEALNLRLFNRLARGWVLTEEGAALSARAEEVEARMLSLRRAAVTLGRVAGPVTLTAPPEVLSEVVVPALNGFQAAYPDVELQLLGDMRAANLSRGEADIALRMGQVAGAELVTQRIGTVAYDFYGAPSVAAQPPDRRRFIQYSERQQPELARAVLRQAGDRPAALQTNTLRAALRGAEQGLGVALLPQFLAGRALEIVETPPAPIRLPLWLVMQRDVRNADRVRALADHLRGALRERLGRGA